MEGKITFSESLRKRLDLLKINKNNLKLLSKKLLKLVSSSIKRNKSFFRKFRNQIYIISGGFKEYIYPVVSKYGIPEKNIFANTFIFNNKGAVIDYDKTNPLSQNQGKIKTLQKLSLDGDVLVLGDGYTDYELKKFGVAKNFTAFTENIKRQSIIDKADQIVSSFDEFLFINHLPTSISYPKNRIKVVLLENINNEAVKKFEKEGYSVEYYSNSFSSEELYKKINNVTILGIRSKTILDNNFFKKNPRLLVVGAFCIGVNQIDIKAATENGTVIFNSPYGNSRSVAELIIGEIIILMRGIIKKNTEVHQGIWNKSSTNSHEIRGKTLGIIGYGNIGTQLSILAEALGMNIIFFDLVDRPTIGNSKKAKNLTELLKKSDVISVHVDGRKENKNIFGEKEFSLMKPGVIFLNSSRGHVVDLNALAKYIKNEKIKGAAIDVFPNEPNGKTDCFSSVLQKFDNVILTPHIGGSTEEAQKTIANYVSDKIIDYINTGNTFASINFPKIQVEPVKKYHRLLHFHKNIPGMLAKINGVIADKNLNVENQLLKTEGDFGYLITDINKKYDQLVLNQLKKIPGTIRFRVLY